MLVNSIDGLAFLFSPLKLMTGIYGVVELLNVAIRYSQ